jgi:hypothetical protein
VRRLDLLPGSWHTEEGDAVRTGVRIRRPGPAVFGVVFGVLSVGLALLWIKQENGNSTVLWAGSAFGSVCMLMGLFFALQAARGFYELVVSPGELVVRRGAGPLIFTRSFRNSDVRKVERVEQISTTDGKRLGTRFYVFRAHGRPWMFGNLLREAEANHLWAALSKGRKSSSRIERISPSSD